MSQYSSVMASFALTASLSCLAQTAVIPSNPLDDLDKLFVPAYQARTAIVDSTHPPYVEVSGSSLLLHLDGKAPIAARVLTEPYHRLKDVAHAPFTVYLTLEGMEAAPFNEAQLETLHALVNKLIAAEAAVAVSGFDPSQQERQHQILNASIHFVSQELTSKSVDPKDLREFARRMSPLMLKDADEAGCFQVQATHKQMMLWKPLFTENEWRNLRVVIKNSHQARYHNADTQYFSWLLGSSSAPSWSLPGESERVLYAEALFGTQAASDEFLSLLVDFDASQAFFGDDWRMSEDIMSTGATRCLAQLPPADRNWAPASGATP